MEQYMKFYFGFGRPQLKTNDQVVLYSIIDWSQAPCVYKNDKGFFQMSLPIFQKYCTLHPNTIHSAIEHLIQYGYIECIMNDEDYAKSQWGQPTRWFRITNKCADIIPDNNTDNNTSNNISNSTSNNTSNNTGNNFITNHNSYINNQNSDISISDNIIDESAKADSYVPNGTLQKSKKDQSIIESKLNNLIANNNWNMTDSNRRLLLNSLMGYSENIDNILARHTGASTPLALYKELSAS